MKLVRRGIIIVCIILLIPLIQSITSVIPEGKYYDKDLKAKVNNGAAKVIEVNKKVKIDNDTLDIQRVIRLGSNIYIRCSINEENGWSFPWSSIKLYDDLGSTSLEGSAESRGKLWGEDALIGFNNVSSSCKEITLKLDLYDRKMEMKIPLEDGGKI